jgi:hypothetical protein
MKKYLLGLCMAVCACNKSLPSHDWTLLDFDMREIETDTTFQKGGSLSYLPYDVVVIPEKDTVTAGETYTARVFLIRRHRQNYQNHILVGEDTLPRNEAGVGKYRNYPQKAGKQQIRISALSRNVVPIFQTQKFQYWVRSDTAKASLPTRDIAKATAIFQQTLPKQAQQNKNILAQIAQKVTFEGNSPEGVTSLKRAKELRSITQQTIKQLQTAPNPAEILQTHYKTLYERYRDLHQFSATYFAKYRHLQLTADKEWNILQIAQKQYQIQQWEKQMLITLFYTELERGLHFPQYLPIVKITKPVVKIGEQFELTVSLEELAPQAGSRLTVNEQIIYKQDVFFLVKLTPTTTGTQHWEGKLLFKYHGRDTTLPVKSTYFIKPKQKV